MKINQFLFAIIYLVLILINEINARTSELLRVTLPNESKLIGKYLTSINGYGLRGFIGIPYAEPPIGDLRFRAPVPAAPWTHERRVMDDVSVCIQWNVFLRRLDIYGTEDCLYLNVYTPLNITKSLPVMVFFHGGGFMAGSGNKLFYGPDYLLDNNDVIYIGANYRLGPLGFLSTGQEDCPGNFGLKDQVLILKWIQENIRVFGGDPNQVTIFGESAGGASVTYLMMSPLSKGLFHKGISQSGTNLNPWAEPINGNLAQQRAIKVGKLLNCTINDNNNNWNLFVKCLRTKTAFDVINIYKHFYDWDVDPMVAFPPVIESPGPNAFISEHPRDATEVHGDSIPWMAGVNLDEGVMKTAYIVDTPELYNDVKSNWTTILPIILYYNDYPTHIKEQITNEINRFYFGNNKRYTKELNQNFTNIISDGWFVAGIDEYIKKRLAKSNQNEPQTYVYLFAHKGESSFTEIFKADPEKYYGVSHSEELIYLFPFGPRFPSAVPSANDIKIRKTMVELWINFVKTGNPTPSYSNLPTWKSTFGYPLEYYRIGNAMDENKSMIEMEKGLFEERCNFWRELYNNLLLQKKL